jgi:flagellar P-ring protein precursor FlgI
MLNAKALDPSTVKITIPPGQEVDRVMLMARLENLDVIPDQSAKVVVDERTGTVVMGERCQDQHRGHRLGRPGHQHHRGAEVSQALPFAQGGETVTTPTTEVKVGEQKGAPGGQGRGEHRRGGPGA